MWMLITVALYATALLLGTMTFFSFVLTPLVFARLEAAVAAGFVRGLFPVYYLIILVGGAVAALGLGLAARPVPAAIMGLVAAFAALTRQLLIPRLDALRAAKEAGEQTAVRQFAALHRFSVIINMTQIVAVAAVLSLFAP